MADRSKTYLAFDLGAESGRAIRGSLDHGRLQIREIYRFPNGMIRVRGHLHWNLLGLFEQIKAGLSKCARECGTQIDSIGVDTWGLDFGFLDRDGAPLGMPYAYRDPRTEGAMESFFRKVPMDRVYKLTGIQLLPMNSLFQLESMVRDRSPLLEIATDLLFIPDLLHYLLTGLKRSEFSFATTSQLFNPVSLDWEAELLDALGISTSMMQEVVFPGTLLGPITEEVRQETCFPDVPVLAVATHDTGSAVAAVPATGKSWAYISSGTWSLMGVESDTPIITEQARRFNFTNEGGVGRTFRVLKNITGLWLLQRCRKDWSDDADYGELTDLAAAAPPLASLIDPDCPDFVNPADMPAAMRAYCRRTGQQEPDSKGAMTRCILESLALKYRWVLEQLRKVHSSPIECIHVIGGGSQNRLLCQLTADATGLPVLAGPVEATAVGNLLVQALAVGNIADLQELRSVVRESFSVTRYDPVAAASWEDPWQRFRQMVSKESAEEAP